MYYKTEIRIDKPKMNKNFYTYKEWGNAIEGQYSSEPIVLNFEQHKCFTSSEIKLKRILKRSSSQMDTNKNK